MDAAIALLVQLLGAAGNIPAVGKVLVVVVAVVGALAGIISGLVGLWHAIIVVLSALAVMPGLGGLKGIAASLQASESSVDDFANNKILAVLNRLSAIPLPQKPDQLS